MLPLQVCSTLQFLLSKKNHDYKNNFKRIKSSVSQGDSKQGGNGGHETKEIKPKTKKR